MKKWSLIIFTILSQMAVGAFWILMAVQQDIGSRYGSVQATTLILPPLMIVEAIMLFSLPISLAHLGSPLIAFRAIANFRSSWLSREIVFALLFTVSSVVFTYVLWGQIGSTAIQMAIAWLAAIFGFLLIYSMSRLYMLRTVPVWNTLFTPFSFFLTALLLGGLVVGTGLAHKANFLFTPLEIDALSMVTIGVLFILGSGFFLEFFRIVNYFSGSGKKKETLLRLLEDYLGVFLYRLLFGMAGSACLVFMLLETSFAPYIYALCFLLVLIAELANRFLFYTARDYSGI